MTQTLTSIAYLSANVIVITEIIARCTMETSKALPPLLNSLLRGSVSLSNKLLFRDVVFQNLMKKMTSQLSESCYSLERILSLLMLKFQDLYA